MKAPRWTILAALCVAVPGCTQLATPQTASDATRIDERIGLGITLAYTTASKMGAILARQDIIDRGRFKVLDAQGFAAVVAARTAYQAANAADYFAAIAKAQEAVQQINALVEAPHVD